MRDLLAPGRPDGAAGNPLDAGALGGGSLQLEKSMGGRPGGGATYPDIPAAVVLGVVMPPEEAVTPYPGVCSTIWLHDWGEPAGRLPSMCTGSTRGSSNSRILVLSTSLEVGVEPQLGGQYHGSDWVAAPAGLLQHLVPRRPNMTN